jgi:peptidoglycan/LPS O-acetylase OafA/YrhL
MTFKRETLATSPAVAPERQLNTTQRSDFRPDIEGMRAVAILIVVAFHAGFGWLRGGFVGVDVFFVLSGYLITDLVANEIEHTGRLNFARFYARRAKRLLPASILLVVVTLLLSFAILSPLEVANVARAALATASYSSNLWFILKSVDYFGLGVDTNPLLHTWSLAVEEQFYLVWPLLLLLCLRRRRPRTVAAGVLAVLAALSFGSCVWLTHKYQPIAFFSTPTRTWEFALGGVAVLLQDCRPLKVLRRELFAWIGTVLLLFAAAFIHSAQGFPGAIALIPVVGTVLILIPGKYSSGTGLFAVLKNPVAQKIGNLSYSWYLWHWPILVFGRTLFPGRGSGFSCLLLVLSFGLAWLSYAIVEAPIRFNARLSAVPPYALALGASLSITAILGGVFALHEAQHWENTPEEIAFLRASSGSVQDDHCATGFRSDQLILCSFGRTDGPSVILFGDSHAGQWIPAMRGLQASGWHVVTMLKSACPSVDVSIYNPHLQREDVNCSNWRAKALDYIRKKKPATVLLCNSSGYVKRPDFQDPYAQVTAAQWEAGMRSTLTKMDTGSTTVLLVRDTPRPGFDVPICLSRAVSHPALFSEKACAISETNAIAAPVWRAEVLAAQGLPYVTPMDLTNQFCMSGQCDPVVNNVVVYRDGNHITLAFSSHLAPVIESGLQSLSKLHAGFGDTSAPASAPGDQIPPSKGAAAGQAHGGVPSTTDRAKAAGA